MIRHATVFWVAIAGLFLAALTVVGSEVRERDQALAQLHRAIQTEQERIHVLKAERAYLSSPERVAVRAREELKFVDMEPEKVVAMTDLPHWVPAPELEIDPDRAAPLLLSSFGLGLDLVGSGRDIRPNSANSAGFAAFPALKRPASDSLLSQAAFLVIAEESRTR